MERPASSRGAPNAAGVRSVPPRHPRGAPHRIYHDAPPDDRGFRPWGRTALRGLKALTAILVYLSPGACCAALGALLGAHGSTMMKIVALPSVVSVEVASFPTSHRAEMCRLCRYERDLHAREALAVELVMCPRGFLDTC